MVEAVVKDTKAIIPTSVCLEGEYGIRDLSIVVPAVLGQTGVERVIELKLNEEEQKAFDKSVEVLRAAVSQLS